MEGMLHTFVRILHLLIKILDIDKTGQNDDRRHIRIKRKNNTRNDQNVEAENVNEVRQKMRSFKSNIFCSSQIIYYILKNVILKSSKSLNTKLLKL